MTTNLEPAESGERYGEREARLDLAAACRLCDLFGWSDLLASHLSARVPGSADEFLINPYGLLFEQVTASSLIKVNLDGEVVEPTEHVLNPGGFIIHSALYRVRDDVRSVFHLHTREGVAVSTQRQGLLPVTQHALVIWHQVRYHDYEGVATDSDECARIAADLGDAKILLLRNHGTLSAGGSVAEAFALMHRLERACRTQIAAQSGGAELNPIDRATVERSVEQGRQIFSSAGFAPAGKREWHALLTKLNAADRSYQD